MPVAKIRAKLFETGAGCRTIFPPHRRRQPNSWISILHWTDATSLDHSTGRRPGHYRVLAFVPVCAPFPRGPIISDRMFDYALSASIDSNYSPSFATSWLHSLSMRYGPAVHRCMSHKSPYTAWILVSLRRGTCAWRSAIGPCLVSSPMNSKVTRPLRGPPVATAWDYWSSPVATLLLLGVSSIRNGMREEERDMHLADVANAWCAWLHVSSRMRRSPVCLFDIRREYSAFVLFDFLLQASLPSFSEFVAIACPVPPSHSLTSISARLLRATHSFAVRLNLGTSRIPQQSV